MERVFSLISLVALWVGAVAYSNSTIDEHISRRLQTRTPREVKRSLAKKDRLKRLISVIESRPWISGQLEPEPWGAKHNPNGPAIFAAAMSTDMQKRDAQVFVGTVRKAGYTGDVVLAVLPGSRAGFVDAIKQAKAVVYTVAPDCQGEYNDKKCSFKGQEGGMKVSINMVRFYIYQYWTSKYNSDALIMLSDFRDVMFQSDPFKYRSFEWAPPVSNLVVFQETYPNKVIYRCVFNGGWISNCYGDEGLRKVGSNTVSCSGVTMGTRDAILAYSHLITQQLDPKVRYGRNTTKTNAQCISLGMDQGFHNWLVYSGVLDRYVDMKIFQQGEGPVNTVGAFFGERAVLKFDLKTWKVLKGEAPKKMFYNYNGQPSPVIHQMDRFLDTEFRGGYEKHLGAFSGISM